MIDEHPALTMHAGQESVNHFIYLLAKYLMVTAHPALGRHAGHESVNHFYLFVGQISDG